MIVHTEKEFIEKYCHNCGSQRCEGIGTAWFEGCQYKDKFELKITPEMYDNGYFDEVGGSHGGGTGVNPMGTFCGECTNLTCKNCPNIFST